VCSFWRDCEEQKKGWQENLQAAEEESQNYKLKFDQQKIEPADSISVLVSRDFTFQSRTGCFKFAFQLPGF
jgi:hypothetical protein